MKRMFLVLFGVLVMATGCGQNEITPPQFDHVINETILRENILEENIITETIIED